MTDYKDEIITKVAWHYYIENLTQQAIAEKLGISRMRVVKLLDFAKQNGIIQFRIAQNKEKKRLLEKLIFDKYKLEDVFVIPSPKEPSRMNDVLAQSAATYISDKMIDMPEPIYVNMGYGDTPSRVLNHLARTTEVPISVVSLTGGVRYYLPNTQSNIFNAKLYLYPSPLMLSDKYVCRALLNEPSVIEISRMTELASFSIIGLGSMDSSATILRNNILSANDFAYLSMQGAVGDILTHFVDRNGTPIQSMIEERLISTSLFQLKALNNVIGIAGGMHKLDIIKAALVGGYLDVLITDEETAAKLVDLEDYES